MSGMSIKDRIAMLNASKSEGKVDKKEESESSSTPPQRRSSVQDRIAALQKANTPGASPAAQAVGGVPKPTPSPGISVARINANTTSPDSHTTAQINNTTAAAPTPLKPVLTPATPATPSAPTQGLTAAEKIAAAQRKAAEANQTPPAPVPTVGTASSVKDKLAMFQKKPSEASPAPPPIPSPTKAPPPIPKPISVAAPVLSPPIQSPSASSSFATPHRPPPPRPPSSPAACESVKGGRESTAVETPVISSTPHHSSADHPRAEISATKGVQEENPAKVPVAGFAEAQDVKARQDAAPVGDRHSVAAAEKFSTPPSAGKRRVSASVEALRASVNVNAFNPMAPRPVNVKPPAPSEPEETNTNSPMPVKLAPGEDGSLTHMNLSRPVSLSRRRAPSIKSPGIFRSNSLDSPTLSTLDHQIVKELENETDDDVPPPEAS